MDEVIGFVVQVTDEVVADLAALDVVQAKVLAHLLEDLWDCVGVVGRHEDDELSVEPWNQTMCLCWILSKISEFSISHLSKF